MFHFMGLRIHFGAVAIAVVLGCGGQASAQRPATGALKGFADAIGEAADEEIARRKAEEQIRRRHQIELDLALRREEAEAKERKRRAEESRARGVSGSGFFVSSRGHIATNLHVVEGFSSIAVRLSSGKTLPAYLVGSDKAADLAILLVGMPSEGLRISRGLVKGERVYAVGYPVPGVQGVESKITEGIVNSFSAGPGVLDWFQHSAPLQPGNSGGPIVNPRGEVVGVAVAQARAESFLRTTGSLPQNVNYAVKADRLLDVMERFAIPPVPSAGGNAAASLESVDRNTVLILSRNVDAPAGVAAASTSEASEEAKVDLAHPGWRSLVRSASFSSWMNGQPAEVKRLATSPRAEDAVLMLTLFKRDRGIP